MFSLYEGHISESLHCTYNWCVCIVRCWNYITYDQTIKLVLLLHWLKCQWCWSHKTKKKPPLTFQIHSDIVYSTVKLISISTLHFLGQFLLHHVTDPHLLYIVFDYNGAFLLCCVPQGIEKSRWSNSTVETKGVKILFWHIWVPHGDHCRDIMTMLWLWGIWSHVWHNGR